MFLLLFLHTPIVASPYHINNSTTTTTIPNESSIPNTSSIKNNTYTRMITDSGCSNHYAILNTHILNKKIATNPINVLQPNGTSMSL